MMMRGKRRLLRLTYWPNFVIRNKIKVERCARDDEKLEIDEGIMGKMCYLFTKIVDADGIYG